MTNHDVQVQIKNIKEVAFLTSIPSSQGLTGRDPWEYDTQVTVSTQEEGLWVCYQDLLAMSLKTDPRKVSETMHLDL